MFAGDRRSQKTPTDGSHTNRSDMLSNGSLSQKMILDQSDMPADSLKTINNEANGPTPPANPPALENQREDNIQVNTTFSKNQSQTTINDLVSEITPILGLGQDKDIDKQHYNETNADTFSLASKTPQ